RDLDLGRILLSPSVYLMGEAVVEAPKPMIEYYIDKQVVNIERTPDAGGSITDALRSTGIVDVNPSTNKISIRGGSHTKIWIDGKPSQLTDDMLAQIPASGIDRVEIIVNPSARHDPEGDSGIINIIMKKGGPGTFSGSASLYTSTRKMNTGSAVVNYKINDLTLFGSVNGLASKYDISHMSRGENYLSRSRRYSYGNDAGTSEISAYQGRFGFDYEIDTMNLISFTGSILKNDAGRTGTSARSLQNEYFIRNDSSYNYNNEGDINRNEFNITGFYRRKFNAKGRELTMDAYMASMELNNGYDYNTYYLYKPDLPELQQSSTDADNITAIYKINYVSPASWGVIEAGYNFTFRDRTNGYSVLNYSYQEQGWRDSLGLSNEFNYKESIHALYGMYSGGSGNFDYRAGIRIEQAYAKGDQRTTGSSFRTDYLSWYPSLTLSYSIWKNFPVSVSASKRISRPQMDMINPFVNRTSPTSYYVGDPEIQPTYLYLYELSFERYLKLFYTTTEGTPTRVTAAGNDGIYTTRVVNMNSSEMYGVESNLTYTKSSPRMPFRLPDWVGMIRVGASYYISETKGAYIIRGVMEDAGAKSYSWRLSGGVNLALWYDVNFNMTANYTPRNNDTRQKGESRTMIYAGFSRAFFDRKLQVRITLTDLLDSGKEYWSEYFAETYYSYSKTVNSIGRNAAISISYSFNNYKPKKERDIGDGRDSDSGMGQGGM
ncbi:MAG TPA: outer membrane beta-barrel protein, partial [Ignavibacteriales bacterium]|nr:outer membrane beta-barrel protein [Ignavibacteriales bacterium]